VKFSTLFDRLADVDLLGENERVGHLLFTEDEWNQSIPQVVKDMTDFLRQYRAPVFEDFGDHGTGWGSGAYLELAGKVFILTNEHVACARNAGRKLGYQFDQQEDILHVVGDHVALPPPFDLALLPVDELKWRDQSNGSSAIQIDQIALAHSPVQTEILTFSGFAGGNVGFHFGTLASMATCYTSREIVLPEDSRFSSRYHFGLDYRPDLATDVIGKEGLPLPPGLSGSIVWNTGFVEAKMQSVQWTPQLARVTGVVWGWPSENACLVATRAEYLRSFLLSL
jgi:hypothetical protein